MLFWHLTFSSCMALQPYESLCLLCEPLPAISVIQPLLPNFFTSACTQFHWFLGVPQSLFPSDWFLKILFGILSASILFILSLHFSVFILIKSWSSNMFSNSLLGLFLQILSIFVLQNIDRQKERRKPLLLMKGTMLAEGSVFLNAFLSLSMLHCQSRSVLFSPI